MERLAASKQLNNQNYPTYHILTIAINLLDTVSDCRGGSIPPLGWAQYFLGAVVFTL